MRHLPRRIDDALRRPSVALFLASLFFTTALVGVVDRGNVKRDELCRGIEAVSVTLEDSLKSNLVAVERRWQGGRMAAVDYRFAKANLDARLAELAAARCDPVRT